MTILFFTSRFWPEIGGVETHALEVAKELVKRGHKVSVISENHGGLKDKEDYKGIEIYRIKIQTSERLKKFAIWHWLFKNRNLIKKADTIHCHDVFYWFLPYKFLYPKKPVFTTTLATAGYSSSNSMKALRPIKMRSGIIRRIWKQNTTWLLHKG